MTFYSLIAIKPDKFMDPAKGEGEIFVNSRLWQESNDPDIRFIGTHGPGVDKCYSFRNESDGSVVIAVLNQGILETIHDPGDCYRYIAKALENFGKSDAARIFAVPLREIFTGSVIGYPGFIAVLHFLDPGQKVDLTMRGNKILNITWMRVAMSETLALAAA